MSDVENSQMDKRVALSRPPQSHPSSSNNPSYNVRSSKNAKAKPPGPGPASNKSQHFPRSDAAYANPQPQLRNKVNNVGELGSIYNPFRDRKGDKGKSKGLRHQDYREEEEEESLFQQHSWKATRTRYVSHSEGYNKEKFLLANCQFVVREGRDYKMHLTNADLLVDWEHVEELRLYCEHISVCPICLSPPTAAQMTRCGHVFCWPCILHYLALSDKSWRKCPICYESVYGNQLKSVVSLQVCKVSVGDPLTMQLMQREKGCVVALPKDHYLHNHGQMRRCDDDILKHFAKMVIASAEEVERSIVKREGNELRMRLEADKDEPEACFVTQAIQLLSKRKETLRNNVDAVKMGESCTSPLKENTEFVVEVPADANAMDNLTGMVEEEASPNSSSKDPQLASDCTSLKRSAKAAAHSSARHYFFYQANDGQQIYLHPINAQCLTQEYGSLESSPVKLRGRVLQLEHVTMTAQLRDRMRYLAHLPLKTNFILAEIKFDKGVLSKKTLNMFTNQLSQRNRERKRRLRNENQLTQKAEHWQNVAFMNAASYARDGQIRSSTEISMSTFVPSAQQDLTCGWYRNEEGGRAHSQSSNEEGEMSKHPSFAEMLKQGKPKASSVANGGWGTASKPNSTINPLEEDDDQSLPAPSYQSTFGDAIAMALDKVQTPSNPEAKSQAGKKSKKKNKGTVLFSL